MVEELIIHIGTHKTGSTSFQHSLNGYEDENTAYIEVLPKKMMINTVRLLDKSRHTSNHFFYYWLFDEKDSGDINNFSIQNISHNKDPQNFRNREIAIRLKPTEFYTQPAFKFKEFIKKHLISQIQSNKKRLILSSEVLCSCSLDYKQNLVNFFKSYGVKNIKVVCVVRDPVELARSMFAHKYILGLRYNLKGRNWFTHHDKNGNPALSYEPTKHNLNEWSDLVGKENLIVLPYSKDIIKKLYGICNVNPINNESRLTRQIGNTIDILRIATYVVKNKLIKENNNFVNIFNIFLNLIKPSLQYGHKSRNFSQIPLNYFIEHADYKQVEYLKKEYGINFKSYEDYTKEEKTTEYKDVYELINDFSKITEKEISYLIEDRSLWSTKKLDDVLHQIIAKCKKKKNLA